MKKTLSCIISLALCASLTACTFTTPSVVMTIDNVEVGAGKYLYYQMGAVSSASSKVPDSNKNIFGQQIEGKSAEEWIHENAVEDIKTYIFIDKALEENSITLTEEEVKNIDTQIDALWEVNEKTYSNNGIGKASLRSVIEDSIQQEKYFTDVFLKDSKNDVSDDDAKKYYEDNYSRTAKLTMPTTDVSNKDLSTENAKKLSDLADEVLKAIQGGKVLDEALVKEYSQKICDITGNTNDDDFVTRIFTTNVLSNEVTDASSEIAKAAAKAKVGDCGIVTEDDEKIVWSKLPTIDTQEQYDGIKDAVKETIQRKALADEVKAVTDTYEVKENASAVKIYSPKKVK